MSCCGKGRQQVNLEESKETSVKFRYVGLTPLTVRGPATEKLYVFDKPGAIVNVDARDRSMFVAMRTMQQI